MEIPDKIIIIDTETTHFRPESAHVVEIGGALVKVRTAEILDTFSSLCFPGEDRLTGAEKALEISGITKAALRGSEPSEIVSKRFLQWLDGYEYKLTGYNSNHYDSAIIARGPWNISPERWNRDLDVMIMAFEAMKLEEPCPLEWMPYYGGKWKWPRLEEAVGHYGITQDKQTHRALDDVRLTAKLLKVILDDAV